MKYLVVWVVFFWNYDYYVFLGGSVQKNCPLKKVELFFFGIFFLLDFFSSKLKVFVALHRMQ